MAAEGRLGGYTISGERAGTDEHPLIRKHLPIDTTVVTATLEPGVLLKEVAVTSPVEAVQAVTETATVTKGAGNTGVTAASVTAATFKTAVSNVAGTYAFGYDGTNWKLSETTVSLETYGVTLTGSPASGDTVSVVFTAAVAAKDATTVTVEHAYVPWAETDTVNPCAVVDDRFDPADETSAICIVHGCVKTRVLKVGATGTTAPSVLALTKLMHNGIFAA